MKRAVTLVEMLVVIAVLAVVLSLAVVGLGKARRASVSIKCIAHLRSCGQAFEQYSVDFDSFFPMFAERTAAPNAFFNGGIPLNYPLQTLHWPVALRGYLGEKQAEPTQLCPANPLSRDLFGSGGQYVQFFSGMPETYALHADYWMTYAAITDPRTWRAGGNFYDPAFYRAVRTAEVGFPSNKGILLEPRAFHIGGASSGEEPHTISIFFPEGAGNSYHVAFADGHCRPVRYSDLTPGFGDNGLGALRAAPVLATPDGILGRDTR